MAAAGGRERGGIKGKKGFLEHSLCLLRLLRLDKVTAWLVPVRSTKSLRYMA